MSVPFLKHRWHRRATTSGITFERRRSKPEVCGTLFSLHLLRFEIQCISLERYTVLGGESTGGSGKKMYSFLWGTLVEVQVRRMDLFIAFFFFLWLGVGGKERFPVNYVSLMAVVLCFDCMCCDLKYSVYL